MPSLAVWSNWLTCHRRGENTPTRFVTKGHTPHPPPPPSIPRSHSSFLITIHSPLSIKWYFSLDSKPPQGVTQFSLGISMNTGGMIHANQFLIILLLLICLIFQEPRRIEGKWFPFPAEPELCSAPLCLRIFQWASAWKIHSEGSSHRQSLGKGCAGPEEPGCQDGSHQAGGMSIIWPDRGQRRAGSFWSPMCFHMTHFTDKLYKGLQQLPVKGRFLMRYFKCQLVGRRMSQNLTCTQAVHSSCQNSFKVNT